MAAREAPTVRQQRLGAELRKLRERSGMSATSAGAHLGMGQSRVSNIEVGRIGVSPERVRAMALAYGCQDRPFITALAAMAEGRTRNWWDDYRERLPASMLDLAELEHHASGIRSAQVALLPGLLQTADYAREIIRANMPSLTPPETESRISYRIRRQEIFYSETPTQYSAIIHEAALRMQFGGRNLAQAQLSHLLEMSEQEHITLLATPFSAGTFPGSGQTVCYVRGPLRQLDTVQLDTEHACEFRWADAQLDEYREYFRRFESCCISAGQSRDLIRSIMKDL